MNNRINNIIEDIKEQYFSEDNNIPWIIGFSGGKDSTVLLTLVWLALRDIQTYSTLKRQIYVVYNDTMVENPIITEYVEDVLHKIQESALVQNLPILVKRTRPIIEDTFWVNVLGKGYPVPNNTFRWCTDRLKIKPTSSFINKQIDENGKAIILIGTRHDESAKRSRSIKKHEIKGKRLSKHSHHYNTYVYSPIKNLMLEEIWHIINTIPSPWGYDNSILFNIYANASADDYECPTVVTDKTHSACGKSRFGCWTCTVVKEDKSMSALIRNGEKWLSPLLQYRNSLEKERNISENRMSTRRNGQLAVTESGHKQGNYTPEYRARKLKELLKIQKEIQKTKPSLELITNQELIAIQIYWYRDNIFKYNVSDIYSSVFGEKIETENLMIESSMEKRLLKDVCEAKEDYELIKHLLLLQHSKILLHSNYGLQNDIEKRIEEFVKKRAYEN